MMKAFDITELANAALAAVKGRNLDSGELTKALDAIRSRTASDPSPFKLWDALDGQIAQAENGALQSALITLRQDFEKQFFVREIEDIASAFRQSADEGWIKWITSLAESLCVIRPKLTVWVAESEFPFPDDKKQKVEEFKRAARKFLQRRYADAYGAIANLAAMEFLPSVVRAKLFVILAEIQDSSDEAKKQLDAAMKLAGNDGRVLSATGDYLLKQKQLDQAKDCFQRAIQASPGIANGYAGMGDYFEEQDQLEAAEQWYKKAIAFAPGDSDGYTRLMQLYGRTELFLTHQQAIQRLAEQLITMTPEEAYLTYFDVVAIYKLNKQYEAARQWYEKAEAESLAALRTDKNNPGPKDTLEGLADDYRSHDDSDHANRIYKSILEIIGEPYRADYHNRLANVDYDREDYQAACKHYEAAVTARPNEAIFHRNLASAYRKLRDFEQAAKQLNIALTLDKDESSDKREMALLANSEGNSYYRAEQYAKAIEKYGQAIELNASDAVMHSNLAGAWENLKEPGRRIENIKNSLREYERAHELDPTSGYDRDVQRLQRRQAFAESYGEKPLDWQFAVNPLAVEVASNLIPHVEGAQGGLSTELMGYVSDMRKRVLDQFGIEVPGIRFRGNDSDLLDGSYIIMVMEIPLVLGEISLNKRFFAGPEHELTALGIRGEKASNPLTGDDGFWVLESDWPKAEAKQLSLWGKLEYVIRHLEAVLRRNLVDFAGHQEVGEIADAAIPMQTLSPQQLTALTAVCKGLISEEAPFLPFIAIYNKFDELHRQGKSLREIVEQIRLLPEVRQKLGADREYTVIRTGPRFEDAVQHSIYENHSHPVLAMKPEVCQHALSELRAAIGDARGGAVLVENPELRPFVRLLIELEYPNLPVFTQQELSADVRGSIAHEIGWDGEPVDANQDFQRASLGSLVATSGKDSSGQGKPETKPPTITLHVPGEAISRMLAEMELANKFSKMREDLFYELGIIVPEVHVQSDSSLVDNEFRHQFNDSFLPHFQGLKQDEFLVNDTVGRLKLLKINARERINPVDGSEYAIVDGKTAKDSCQSVGLTTWDAADYMVLVLSAEVRRRAAMFQTMLVAQFIVDSLRPTQPHLIDTVLSCFTLEQINGVLRELLDEEISVRNVRGIFEGLLSVNGVLDADLSSYIVFCPHVDNLCPVAGPRALNEITVAEYADVARTALKRYISHKYTRGSNTLPVYLVDHNIEIRLGNIDAEPVTGEENDRLLKAVRAGTQGLPAFQKPVLLTSFETRRPLRRLLEQEFPRLAVLSYQELPSDMNIQPVARISWT